MRAKCAATALAGVLLFTLCPASGSAQQPPGAASEAEAHFFAGQKLYGDKQYQQALAELRASYAATPSPNSRLYIARCLREMGRSAEAAGEYAQVILEAAEKLGSET